jgi:hypothetical protein
MLTLTTFIVSGVMIVILLAGKVWEEKNRKSFFLLRWISKGDERFREFSQTSAHKYADLKEEAGFIIKRQVPLHTRNIANKTYSQIEEKSKKFLSNLKEGKLFGGKSEGISEFLKDISEMEKDNEAVSNADLEGSQNEESQVK